MTPINTNAARARFAEILRRVEAGETFAIVGGTSPGERAEPAIRAILCPPKPPEKP